MGYYSNLALDSEEQNSFHDYSYPSPEMQLKFRIEELFYRLEELQCGGSYKTVSDFRDCRLSRTDLEYALPNCLSNVDDIITAIAIAKIKLQHASDELQCEHSEVQAKEDVVLPGQITIWEYEEKKKDSFEKSLLAAA